MRETRTYQVEVYEKKRKGKCRIVLRHSHMITAAVKKRRMDIVALKDFSRLLDREAVFRARQADAFDD